MSLELDIIIEKVDGVIAVPLAGEGIQVRSDGITINGSLHLWEEILTVHITNRGLLKQLKSR